MNPDFSQPPEQIQGPNRKKKPFWGLPGCLLGLILVAVLYAILMPVFAKSRSASTRTQTIHNMKQVGTGFMLYVSENDGRFPSADSWQDDVYPFVKNREIFSSPLKSSDGIKTTVAMNSGLSNVSEAEVAEPSKTVLTFLSTQTRPSPRGGKESMAVLKESRTLLGFADTSVIMKTVDEAKGFIWNPVTKK
jgi:hypothetical protein